MYRIIKINGTELGITDTVNTYCGSPTYNSK